MVVLMDFNPLRVNPTKWSNTLKQFVGCLMTNCLSVFDHFVRLVLKGLISSVKLLPTQATAEWILHSSVIAHHSKQSSADSWNQNMPNVRQQHEKYQSIKPLWAFERQALQRAKGREIFMIITPSWISSVFFWCILLWVLQMLANKKKKFYVILFYSVDILLTFCYFLS